MAKIAAIKPKQAKYKKYMLVRYGRMNTLGFFEHHETHIPKMPTRLVVKTDRGLELGWLVGQLCPYKAGQFRLNQNQIKKYFGTSDIDLSVEQTGKLDTCHLDNQSPFAIWRAKPNLKFVRLFIL